MSGSALRRCKILGDNRTDRIALTIAILIVGYMIVVVIAV